MLQEYKARYLKALLLQEIEWYDSQNIAELPSKVNAQLKDIEYGSGKSVGFIIFSISLTTAAFIASFYMAGTLALCTMAALPCIAIAGAL